MRAVTGLPVVSCPLLRPQCLVRRAPWSGSLVLPCRWQVLVMEQGVLKEFDAPKTLLDQPESMFSKLVDKSGEFLFQNRESDVPIF